MELSIGSLFSGIGGLELGLELAGVGETRWQVEIDPYCQKVLRKHWKDTTIYDDIETVDWSKVEPVEVVCGGFPCQDISIAGRGEGLAGERSGLWREFARCVRSIRPRYVVVENVPALTFRGMGDVLGDLASFGYDCEWDCIPAAAVGANHRRERIFIVAYPCGSRRREDTGSAFGSEEETQRWSEEHYNEFERDGSGGGEGYVAHSNSSGRFEQRGSSTVPSEFATVERSGEIMAYANSTPWSDKGRPSQTLPRSEAVERFGRCSGSIWNPWVVEPDVGRVANGIPRRMDRLRGLGNAVVPQVAAVIGEKIVQLEQELIYET